jgi:hypothetical protein
MIGTRATLIIGAACQLKHSLFERFDFRLWGFGKKAMHELGRRQSIVEKRDLSFCGNEKGRLPSQRRPHFQKVPPIPRLEAPNSIANCAERRGRRGEVGRIICAVADLLQKCGFSATLAIVLQSSWHY